MTTHHTRTTRGAKTLASILGISAAASLFLLAAQPPTPPAVVRSIPPLDQLSEITKAPHAVVLSEHGKCEYSEDGVTFVRLRPGRILKEGAVVRAANNSSADLFFRRIGTSVRIQQNTELKLESMTRELKDGMPVMRTLLDLRSGSIFTVVRSLVPDCTFEIRNKAGRSVVEGGLGKGRYIITADGTHVTDKDSEIPLKVIGETGVTIVTPGQKFHAKEGKLFPLDPPESVELMIDFDELDSLAEQLAPIVELPPAPKN